MGRPEVISETVVCQTCGDTGQEYHHAPGHRAEWLDCSECRVCAEHEQRFLIDEGCAQCAEVKRRARKRKMKKVSPFKSAVQEAAMAVVRAAALMHLRHRQARVEAVVAASKAEALNPIVLSVADTLRQEIASLDSEIANAVGITAEQRADLERKREAYLTLLQREEGGHVID